MTAGNRQLRWEGKEACTKNETNAVISKSKNAHVYCFNVSTTFILGWGAIRSFLDPLIVSKTMLVAENTCTSIQSFVNPDQLLEDYGGTSKLPEQLWPPVIPNPLRQTVMHKLEIKLDETTSDRL